MVNEIQQAIQQTPVVTRCIFIISAGLFFAGPLGLLDVTLFFCHWPSVIKKLEVWRVVTAFLLPLSDPLRAFMDVYILYQNSRRLEEDKFAGQSSDYFYCLTIVGAIIMALNVPLGGMVYMHPLLVAMTALWANDNREQLVSFYVLTIKAKYLPPLYLVSDFLLGGVLALLVAVTGLTAAAAYIFLKEIWPSQGGPVLAETPDTLRRFFNEPVRPRVRKHPFGSSFASKENVSSGYNSRTARSVFSGTRVDNAYSTAKSAYTSARRDPFEGAGRQLGD